jgi:hypothetical protein
MRNRKRGPHGGTVNWNEGDGHFRRGFEFPDTGGLAGKR